MSVTFLTSNPQELLNSFNARIEQTEAAGKITTWVRSEDKLFYTHKAVEWANKAWFSPAVEAGKLTFNIIKPKNANISTTVYGYYHGHLIETFLNHFDKMFSVGQATALATVNDVT